MIKLPSVGSQVCVKVRTRDIYIFALEPYRIDTYAGEVVAAPRWCSADYFAVKTGRPEYPISLIRMADVVHIEQTSGKSVDTEVFEVTGSKGDKYIVTRTGDHYSCNCTGFTFRGKCKHSTPEFIKGLK